MSRIVPMAVSLAALTGCEFVVGLTDAFEGITEPLVVVGAVIDVDLPEGVSLEVEGTPFESGTSFAGALADAGSVADGVGIAGASVSIEGIAAEDQGDGSYLIAPGALEYWPSDTWSLDVQLDGTSATAWVNLPEAAEWTAPASHRAGQDLVVDLGDQPFDTMFVAVVDAATGSITWTNQPSTTQDLLVALHASGPLVVTVPGAVAFPGESTYWIGVAAAVRTKGEDLVGMNTALSAILAGRMVVQPLPVAL